VPTTFKSLNRFLAVVLSLMLMASVGAYAATAPNVSPSGLAQGLALSDPTVRDLFRDLRTTGALPSIDRIFVTPESPDGVTQVYIPVTGSSDLGGVLVVVQLTKHSVLDVLVVRQSETVAGVITGTATSLVTGKVFTGEVQAGDGQGGISAMYDTTSAVCGIVWVFVGAAVGATGPAGAIAAIGIGIIGVFECTSLSSGGNSSGGTIGHSNAVTP